jgi:hypothetical protein
LCIRDSLQPWTGSPLQRCCRRPSLAQADSRLRYWGNRHTERRDDQLRRQDRLADTYIAVLDLAEREAHWSRSEAVRLDWLTDESFTTRPVIVERPVLSDRTTVEARLLGSGTDAVVAAYRAWRTTLDHLEAELTNVEWNLAQEGRDPNEPLDRSYVQSFINLLTPQE